MVRTAASKATLIPLLPLSQHFPLLSTGVEKPDTPAGKFVGSMCAVLAIFTLILPIPIVVNSFSAFYRNRLWRNEVAIQRRDRQLKQEQCGQLKAQDAGHIELNGVTA